MLLPRMPKSLVQNENYAANLASQVLRNLLLNPPNGYARTPKHSSLWGILHFAWRQSILGTANEKLSLPN